MSAYIRRARRHLLSPVVFIPVVPAAARSDALACLSPPHRRRAGDTGARSATIES
jgi:hypothetical protein